MKLNFLNANVPDARFEIRWGEKEENKTTDFNLAPGAAGVLDLADFTAIPEGAKVRIHSWQEGRGSIDNWTQPFKYIKGKKIDGTFKIVRNEKGLLVDYIDGQAA